MILSQGTLINLLSFPNTKPSSYMQIEIMINLLIKQARRVKQFTYQD